MKKQLVMSMALLGALFASGKEDGDEDPLRYPEKTQARLIAKEVKPLGLFNDCYYDLDGKLDTAEAIFRAPKIWDKEFPVGSYATVKKLCGWAESAYYKFYLTIPRSNRNLLESPPPALRTGM